MSKQQSNNQSFNDDKLQCSNCGSNLKLPPGSEYSLNVLYNLNEGHFTCKACNKVIADPDLDRELRRISRVDELSL